MFPSPCGVNIVGNDRFIKPRQYAWFAVSVPLRGKYCRESRKGAIAILEIIGYGFPSPCGVNIVGNSEWWLFANSAIAYVSVPLRGKYCRECYKLLQSIAFALHQWFPSPCGVNIVGNDTATIRVYEDYFLVSVPLRGKYCRE